MTIPETKTERVRAVLQLLTNAELTARQITQRLGLEPNKLRSVQRDLEDLMLSGDIERLPQGKYRCPPQPTTLNPVESLAVYSAARMLYHHASEYNRHYLSALEKLTSQLPDRAKRVASAANDAYRSRQSGRDSRAFELVAQAWLQGQVLRFKYCSAEGKVRPVELEIYFIELSPQNRQAYAVGVNRLKGGTKPYVFRLSRMSELNLLNDSYDIPEDFSPLQFLSNTWGVMTGEPTRIELHFSPAMKERVMESALPPDAELRVLGSGYIRLVMTIGGWRELIPWVLGWGGEVEVIEPDKLRQMIAEAHAKGAGLYERR